MLLITRGLNLEVKSRENEEGHFEHFGQKLKSSDKVQIVMMTL